MAMAVNSTPDMRPFHIYASHCSGGRTRKDMDGPALPASAC
jgi:hypothetical protein